MARCALLRGCGRVRSAGADRGAGADRPAPRRLDAKPARSSEPDLRGVPSFFEGRGQADQRSDHSVAGRILFRLYRVTELPAGWVRTVSQGIGGICAISVNEGRTVLDVIGQLHREYGGQK